MDKFEANVQITGRLLASSGEMNGRCINRMETDRLGIR